MLSRRAMREQAFELVFENGFSGEEIDKIIELATDARDIEVCDYARSAAKGVAEHCEEIDIEIEKYCVARSKSRLSRVVLSVLRLALYEIIFDPNIEASISINEAVELTKKFASDEEAGFVNGVLGSYMRAVSPEQ